MLEAALDAERRQRGSLERSLLSMRARFAALMDAMPEAVLVVDGRSGVVKQVKVHAGELFRMPVDKLIGLSVEELIPLRQRTLHPAYRVGFIASIRKREMGYHPPISALRGDGSKVELAIALTATTIDEDVMVVCTEYADWAAAPSHEEAGIARKSARRQT